MDSPFSIASRPFFNASAGNGGTSGFGRWLIAMPQYAIAQLGSVSGIAVNALTVSGKKKECSMASARSNCFCASGEQDVLNTTRPSFSPRALVSSSWAQAAVEERTRPRPRIGAKIFRLLIMSCLPGLILRGDPILTDEASHGQSQDVLPALGQRGHRGGGADRDALSPPDGAAAQVHARAGGGILRDSPVPLRSQGPLPALAADPRRGRRPAPGSGAAPHTEAAPTAGWARALEQRCQGRGRVLAGDDRDDLELDQVGPLHDPALQQRDVVALHQLKAASHIGLHPAADEGEPIRHLPAAVAQPPIDGLAVLIAKRLNDHEQHGDQSSSATARVHPAEAPRIFTGKHAIVKPRDGSASRLCSFSRWQ